MKYNRKRADPVSNTLLAARVPFEAPDVLVGGSRFTQDEWRRRGVHVKASEKNGRCIHVGGRHDIWIGAAIEGC